MTAKTKALLRKELRAARRAHVAAQPDLIRALLFNHPPRPLVSKIDRKAVIALYFPNAYEAPTSGYARFFSEQGHTLALPRFAGEGAAMEFARHSDPIEASDLEPGPFGLMQPRASAPVEVPGIVFAPLVGFTSSGQRLGQGGGHYDRWLAEHPGVKAIGLAWDVQLVTPGNVLPVEPHDVQLDAVVTPTRMYGKL
ncbi:MAG: 5-formyltetrahydrofolate cyclo-ligase [Pseudomonadota bacterium]